MDADQLARSAQVLWDGDALRALGAFIRIPNVSPMFAPDWAEAGHMAAATALLRDWAAARPIPGLSVEVAALPGRTPLIVIDAPAAGGGPAGETVLLYGHLDKQPAMSGWRAGLGPWAPVRDGDRLYGRGSADDGYALFAALGVLEALRAAGGAHSRCVVVVEASEESGSPDLPAYIDALSDRIGTPSLVVCLDSGCETYDRLWVTTSLRGIVGLSVTVEILEEGVHSGSAGGVVPSSFRILRQLLSRIEDESTGHIRLPELHVEIPPARRAQLEATAVELGAGAAGAFPLVSGASLIDDGAPFAQVCNRTWRPALATVGLDGIPPTGDAGNVLRPLTRAKLSVRLPPTLDAELAAAALVRTLSADPPNGARVTVEVADRGTGWDAPPTEAWLASALDAGSDAGFGRPARYRGEGGSIPFMAMLGARFPDAQFVVTGVLGPGSNAHGPNEFLHLPTAVAVTTAVAHVLDAHARKPARGPAREPAPEPARTPARTPARRDDVADARAGATR